MRLDLDHPAIDPHIRPVLCKATDQVIVKSLWSACCDLFGTESLPCSQVSRSALADTTGHFASNPWDDASKHRLSDRNRPRSALQSRFNSSHPLDTTFICRFIVHIVLANALDSSLWCYMSWFRTACLSKDRKSAAGFYDLKVSRLGLERAI